MQYILSEEEYRDLTKKSTNRTTADKKILQELCTKVADHMPLNWGWGGTDPKPWGCIITAANERGGDEWYCDKCPVQEQCPCDYKNYSK